MFFNPIEIFVLPLFLLSFISILALIHPFCEGVS